MHVVEVPGGLQGVDDSVDGALVDGPAGDLFGALVQFVGGQVLVVRLSENLAHRRPGLGDAKPRLAEAGDEDGGVYVCHVTWSGAPRSS